MRRSWSTLSDHEAEVEGETYRATRFIYTEDTLYGQGKLIYATRPTLDSSRSDALVKCSWHLVLRIRCFGWRKLKVLKASSSYFVRALSDVSPQASEERLY